MRDTETSPASRAPVASGALLSAALGGLLCFTASCESTGEPGGSDAASSADVVTAADARATSDAVAPTDVVTATDVRATSDVIAPADVVSAPADVVSAPADVVSAPADAPSPVDASAPTDVVDAFTPTDAVADVSPSLDAAIPTDARAGADATSVDAPFVCDVAADRVIGYSDAAPGMTLEIFRAMCDRVGGFIEVHPHCGGANSCAGFSFDQTIGVFTEHSCQALNTCTGWTCVRR